MMTVFYKIVFDSKHGSLSALFYNSLDEAKNELMRLANHKNSEYAAYWREVAMSAKIYKVIEYQEQIEFTLD